MILLSDAETSGLSLLSESTTNVPVVAMEASVKLPLLRLGELSTARRSDQAGHGREEDSVVLPPLTSPSRAALLLVNSAPCASTQSLGSVKRKHAQPPKKSGARSLQPEDHAKSPLELATEQLRASRVSLLSVPFSRRMTIG